MAKILIFGNGYMGNHFKSHFAADAELSPADICNSDQVEKALEEFKPDYVLNCAGKTGKPNIDWCEDHKDEALASNVMGPINLVRHCVKRSIHFTQLSSGCIYAGDNGGKGFAEGDEPNFFGSYYSRTKIMSEATLSEFPVLTCRMRMPIDGSDSARNLITKISKYSKIISIPNSISVVNDFVGVVAALMKKNKTGIYNVTNPEPVTHVQILEMYKEIVNPDFLYEVFSLEELGKVTKAGRSNCILDVSKLADEGLQMRPTLEAIRQCLNELAESKA